MSDKAIISLHQRHQQDAKRWQVMSFFLFLLLLLTIGVVTPTVLYVIKPQIRYIEIKTDGTFKVLPTTLLSSQRRYLEEQELQNYIKDRLNLNGTKLTNGHLNKDIIETVASKSSDNVRRQYSKELRAVYESAAFDRRKTKIINYHLVDKTQNIYRFDISINDYFKGELGGFDVQSTRYVLHLQYKREDIALYSEEHFKKNPLAIKVTHFQNQEDISNSVQEIEIDD